jgi:hypothetical protein
MAPLPEAVGSSPISLRRGEHLTSNASRPPLPDPLRRRRGRRNLGAVYPGLRFAPPRAITFRPFGTLGFGSLRSRIDERTASGAAGPERRGWDRSATAPVPGAAGSCLVSFLLAEPLTGIKRKGIERSSRNQIRRTDKPPSRDERREPKQLRLEESCSNCFILGDSTARRQRRN